MIVADLAHTLLAPWQEPLIRRAFLEATPIGLAGGALGRWVLFYNLAYGAESPSHTLLPGLVVAALTGIPSGWRACSMCNVPIPSTANGH